jgi:hypothetical protein
MTYTYLNSGRRMEKVAPQSRPPEVTWKVPPCWETIPMYVCLCICIWHMVYFVGLIGRLVYKWWV